MKKLSCLLSLVVLFFLSCSDDDHDHMGESFSLEMKVETTASYYATELSFFAKDITIDWGDGSEPYYYNGDGYGSWSSQDVEHIYPKETGIENYTIKITGKGLNNIDIKQDPLNTDYLGSIVKEVRTISCPELKSLGLREVAGMQNFNFTSCPNLEWIGFTGVHAESLDLSNMSIKSVAFTMNTNLKTLKLNSAIESIYLNYNPLLTADEVNLTQFKNLKSLTIYKMGWTLIDLKANTKLDHLYINETPITNLDLTKNTELSYLDCDNTTISAIAINSVPKLGGLNLYGNRLSDNALNTVFTALPNVTPNQNNSYKIEISGNPGTNTCDKTIAINKGWSF